MPQKVIFINSHPIQYFAPLFKHMNGQGVPTACWYCSDENVRGHTDREFQSCVLWDIPMLDGYEFRFFKNYSWTPSLYNGFFGLINPTLLIALVRERHSVIVVHGWASFTHVLAIIVARLVGHTVCLRGESPLNQELLKSGTNQLLKRFLLGGFIFLFVQKFLYIGSQNKAFYQHFGVIESKLFFAPYAVDNSRFQKAAAELAPHKSELRTKLGLPVASRIILFTAKFISKKRPLDLLVAYDQLEIPDKCLVMVGDGELRPEMEKFIREKGLTNVYLTGFINQSSIVEYYAIADVFVLCSGRGETWGLSVNEALNFALPVVVSDIAGCSSDLVKEGLNGYVSKSGNVNDLLFRLTMALGLKSARNDVLKTFSYETTTNFFKSQLN